MTCDLRTDDFLGGRRRDRGRATHLAELETVRQTRHQREEHE